MLVKKLVVFTLLLLPLTPAGYAADRGERLVANSIIRRELSAAEKHSYNLTLDVRQYFGAVVYQNGLGVLVTVYGPGGQKIASPHSRQDGTTPISLISAAAGVYRLEISAGESDAPTGSYELKVREIRESTIDDKRRVAAEEFASSAERLRSNETEQANRRAVVLYERSLSHWRAIGDAREEARTLKTIGEILQPIGEATRALGYYNNALRVAQRSNDQQMEGEIRSSLAFLQIHLGETQKALDSCDEALQLSRAANNHRGEAEALTVKGEAYSFKGELQKALDCLERALLLWSEIGDLRGQARTQLYRGYGYSDLAESPNAFEAYNKALSLWKSLGDRRGQALTLIGLGHLHSRLGAKQEALEAYDQAKRLIQTIGDPVGEARLLNGMAFVYSELGDNENALRNYRQATLLFRSAGYKPGEAACLVVIGGIYYSNEAYSEALKYLRQAIPIIKALNDRILESYSFKYLAAVYDSMGQADKALDYYTQALDLFRAAGDRRGEAFAINGIANINDVRGDKQKALELRKRALMLNREVGNRFGEVSTLFNIARSEREAGALTDARGHIEEAINKIESLRADVNSQELRASFIATESQNYELCIDLLMHLHKPGTLDGLDAKALHVSERGRARSLVEMLAESRADIRQGVEASILERARVLQQSLKDKEERYSRLFTGKPNEEQVAAALKKLEEIRTEYQQVQSQIRSTSPRYAALTQPQPLTLKEIQEQVLDSDTLLLEYALGDERSYLWAVTPDSLTTFELPKRADIEVAARRVYDALTTKNPIGQGPTVTQKSGRAAPDADYSSAALALSRMVIQPVASQLGTKRLLIVADGALQYIPFAALPVPAAKAIGDGSHALAPNNDQDLAVDFKPLIVDHEIVSLPSASTLAVMRRELAGRKPAPKSIAVLADPVFSSLDPRVVASSRVPTSKQNDVVSRSRDFERAIKEVRVSRKRSGVGRLPFSRAEAAAIRAVAPPGQSLEAIDFDASRATATSSQLSEYRIIHFATHGLLNSEHPELSGMVFSLVDRQGKSQNGFLRLNEVYNLNLPAELVVLSACQTGLGKDVKGEGLIGLTRGFMYAGAARVMASLWQVDDSATAELMKRFYVRMLGDGLRPAAALRDAQVEMSKQKRWQAPYNWAGFVLQGEWK